MDLRADRVRRRFAKIFDTPKELETYLREHPNADKSRHSVKPQQHAQTPHPAEDEHHEKLRPKDRPAPSGGPRLKGVSDAGKKYIESAPKAVHKFLTDPKARKSTLTAAWSHLKKSGRATIKRLVDTAKDEVEEYKTAIDGVKTAMNGGTMSKHHKHAVKAVATHIALGATAAAFAAGGGLIAGTGVFLKGMVKHVAYKAVHRSMTHVHKLEEIGHIGHGISHFMEHIAADGSSKPDPDEAFASLVIAAVAKELEGLDDSDLEAIVNEQGEKHAAKKTARVVARFLG